MEWDDLDPEALFETIRKEAPPADAETLVWALEHVLAGARLDPGLVDYFAVAGICALAYRDGKTPRAVLEGLFRRAIDDERWRADYAGLLRAPT